MDFNITLNQSANPPLSLEPSIILSYILPLAILAVGIFLYGFIVFKFYKYLARRDIVKLKLDPNQPMAFKIFLYLLNQLGIVPILIFFWFIVMACVLIFLSKSTASYIMLVSMATIAAIRITSYYKLSLAEDLAKLLPLTLFSVFILQMDFGALTSKISLIKEMFGLINLLIFYLAFAVLIEFIMRTQQLIRDVLEIRKHNRKIDATASNDEKKSYNMIFDGTFKELAMLKDAELTEKPKTKLVKKEKKYSDDNAL